MRLALLCVVMSAAGCGVGGPLGLDWRGDKAHGKHVDFGLTDGSVPATTASYIGSKNAISPYTQWMENNGYCGELSAIEAGMGSGQWMSQFNSRLICGTGLSQSGPDGFCAANDANANYNAQFLFESPNPGDQTFASAPTCLANSHLGATSYDYRAQPSGTAGYQQFMSWVKTRLIAGDTVAIGVLDRDGTDPQYDHEVTVSKIGTNHARTDASYYDDDVSFFEDHGVGGNSFTQGYTFASLAQTRDGANAPNANSYSILIPGGAQVNSGTGGDGIHVNPHAITPVNYGFAVAGPLDPSHELQPLAVAIVGSSVNGVANAPSPTVGYNFESPTIGQATNADCTNVAPTWMDISLKVTVGGLVPGVAYNLYEYDFSDLSGLGSGASLKVPNEDFNAFSEMATKATRFVADAATFTQTIETASDEVVVWRAVRADGP